MNATENSLDATLEYWFFRKEVAGALAMWAIRQSPYPAPEGLADAVKAMHDALPGDARGMFAMSERALRDEIHRICLEEPTITAWNMPKSGHNANFVFSSRYDHPEPDDDFIDLYALAGNICRTLLSDQDNYPATSGMQLSEDASAAEGEALQPGGDSRDAQPSSNNAAVCATVPSRSNSLPARQTPTNRAVFRGQKGSEL